MKYLAFMRSFLLQPYPFGESIRKKLLVCAGAGIFVTFFLAVFRPFGFDELSTVTCWQHAAFFGLVTLVVSTFCQVIIPKLFPSIFQEVNWKSWKEIVFLLFTTLLIGTGNYGLMLYLHPQGTEWSGLLRAELITLQVGIFPVSFVVFMKQMKLYRRFAAEAEQMTEDIREEERPTEPASLPVLIQLRGDNQKEELSLRPEDLFFVSSADNYVRIQFRETGGVKSMLMRSTLKKMEEQLASQSSFFRCHRMYLVNLQLVEKVSGNAQGLKLHLTGLEEAVPVSRSLTEIIKERLHHLFHSPQNA